MRVLNAKSKEIIIPLASVECICGCDLLADFPTAFIGSVAIAIGLVAMASLATLRVAGAIGGSILIFWVGFFAWRAYFTNRNWVVAVSQGTLLLRLFRNLGRSATVAAESDVLELVPTEVESWSVQVIEIIWSSIRRTTIQCLAIEPTAVGLGCTPGLISELESFSNYSCGTAKHRLTVYENGRLLIEWSYKRPPLDEFLERVSRALPSISLGKTRHVSLDLKGFILLPEHEQRNLLLQLKKFGLSQACVNLLKRRMRMSTGEAAKLMDSL